MEKLRSDCRGFTLMEAMIVIGLITILVGIAGTSLVQWLPNYRFNAYLRDLQSVVQEARLAAVRDNADRSILFDKINRECLLFVDDTSNAANTGIWDAGDQTLGSLPMPVGVEFTELFGGGADTEVLSFNSKGFASRSGEIHMKNSKDKFKGVSVTLTGKSKIIRSADGVVWE